MAILQIYEKKKTRVDFTEIQVTNKTHADFTQHLSFTDFRIPLKTQHLSFADFPKLESAQNLFCFVATCFPKKQNGPVCPISKFPQKLYSSQLCCAEFQISPN